MRQAGVICSIDDLKAGDLGQDAYHFIDFLAEEKIQVWHVNSFYHDDFYLSGDKRYISIDKLCEYGLLSPFVVDGQSYSKEELLKMSFDNFVDFYDEYKKEYKKFLKQAFWLDEYVEKYEFDHDYHRYIQFIFKKQFSDFKKYANDKNISIMMDTHMIKEEVILRRYLNLSDIHHAGKFISLIDYIVKGDELDTTDIIISSDYFSNMTISKQFKTLDAGIQNSVITTVSSNNKDDVQLNFIHHLMSTPVNLVLVNIYDYTNQDLNEKISFQVLNKKRFKLRNIVDSCQRKKQYR